jgi:hypothetical protein
MTVFFKALEIYNKKSGLKLLKQSFEENIKTVVEKNDIIYNKEEKYCSRKCSQSQN